MNLLRLNIKRPEKKAVYYNSGVEKSTWITASYMFTDVFFIVLSMSIIFLIRFYPEGFFENINNLKSILISNYNIFPGYAGFLVLHSILVVLLFLNSDLYNTEPKGRFWGYEVIEVIKGVSIATLILMVLLYLTKQQLSRFIVVSNCVSNMFILSGWRYLKYRRAVSRYENGDGLKRILIVGAGRVGYKLARMVESNRHLGLQVRGFVDDYKKGQNILGGLNDLPSILQGHFIDEVYVTIPSERELVKRVTREALDHKIDVKVIPDVFDGIALQKRPMSFGLFGDLPVMEIYHKPIPVLGLSIKRTMDIFGGVVMFILTFPILLAVAIAIKIDSPEGPVIYHSNRVGLKGRYFKCYKFRTMLPNANDLKNKLRETNERSGPFFKMKKDPRITKVGMFLRKYSFDELPQMFNLLSGDMSLVGPRPHPLDDFELYSLEHYRRLDVKPGITSLWAVEARSDPSFEKNMELDIQYIENWNIWLDIKIILKTIPAVFKGSGI